MNWLQVIIDRINNPTITDVLLTFGTMALIIILSAATWFIWIRKHPADEVDDDTESMPFDPLLGEEEI